MPPSCCEATESDRPYRLALTIVPPAMLVSAYWVRTLGWTVSRAAGGVGPQALAKAGGLSGCHFLLLDRQLRLFVIVGGRWAGGCGASPEAGCGCRGCWHQGC